MLRASETLSHSCIVCGPRPSPHTFFSTLPFPWYLEHNTWSTESGVQDTPPGKGGPPGYLTSSLLHDHVGCQISSGLLARSLCWPGFLPDWSADKPHLQGQRDLGSCPNTASAVAIWHDWVTWPPGASEDLSAKQRHWFEPQGLHELNEKTGIKSLSQHKKQHVMAVLSSSFTSKI